MYEPTRRRFSRGDIKSKNNVTKGGYTISSSSGEIDGSKTRLFLHGETKIGKTGFAVAFPGSLLLATEKRYEHLKVPRVIDINEWELFREVVQDLSYRPKKFPDVKVVVIDTADNSWDYCDRWYCDKSQIEHVSEHGYGKGLDCVKVEYRRVMNELFASQFGLIFISHTQMIEVRKPNGDVFEKTISTLNKHAKAIILKQVGVIGHVRYKNVTIEGKDGKRTTERKRVISFVGNEDVEAGDGEGRLPKEITLYKDTKKSVDEFLSYYEEGDDD